METLLAIFDGKDRLNFQLRPWPNFQLGDRFHILLNMKTLLAIFDGKDRFNFQLSCQRRITSYFFQK